MEVIDPPPTPVVRPKPKRLRYIVAGGLCAAAGLFLVVGGLSRNIVYFRTVSEAVRAHDNAPTEGGRLPMAGAVVTRSVVPPADRGAFRVTPGCRTASVFPYCDP